MKSSCVYYENLPSKYSTKLAETETGGLTLKSLPSCSSKSSLTFPVNFAHKLLELHLLL